MTNRAIKYRAYPTTEQSAFKNRFSKSRKKNNAISLDYASDGLYVDNNGNVDTNHKYYQNYNGGGLMYTTDNLRFVMDETSVPYEQNENPFPRTNLDDEFETMIINKYHLTTKEMEDTN